MSGLKVAPFDLLSVAVRAGMPALRPVRGAALQSGLDFGENLAGQALFQQIVGVGQELGQREFARVHFG